MLPFFVRCHTTRRDSKAVMPRIANPVRPVRLRLAPPTQQIEQAPLVGSRRRGLPAAFCFLVQAVLQASKCRLPGWRQDALSRLVRRGQFRRQRVDLFVTEFRFCPGCFHEGRWPGEGLRHGRRLEGRSRSRANWRLLLRGRPVLVFNFLRQRRTLFLQRGALRCGRRHTCFAPAGRFNSGSIRLRLPVSVKPCNGGATVGQLCQRGLLGVPQCLELRPQLIDQVLIRLCRASVFGSLGIRAGHPNCQCGARHRKQRE